MKNAGHALAALCGLGMVAAGASKLAGVQMHVDHFVNTWGFGLGFMYFTGVVELVGGALLIVPKTRLAGAALLCVTMVGAIATHVMFGEYADLGPPIVLGAMAAGAGYIATREG